MNTLIRPFLRNESGASASEFALVLPLVLIVIFGAITAGALGYTIVNLQQATETSARCLSAKRSDCSLDNITTFAQNRYSGPSLNGLAFTAEWNADCNGYRVTGSGTFGFFMGSGLLSVPLSTQACYPGFNS
ncbi:TadE/TadG family type IV pilus assembly protein [Novosphingobium album (ex Hu et al. 2023)]|uniref:Pilus assembly protein n=1 Tax=Novosphingobium album (ex Hu et al. 2023) TaxID=2930093 RepID=A0ABT0B0X2_9SPHN|nr:TadE/TadG family type IV pilus assembly protein [Novosphingobium album (ex Hu et al. 2023)]MCJ2178718.1 pilus assembly protein [Novosphingobium album (ex Hu et al. 2023)]